MDTSAGLSKYILVLTKVSHPTMDLLNRSNYLAELDRPNKLPAHLLTDLLPHLILLIQLFARLQQLETRQELIHLQKLAELVEHIRIGQEIRPIRRTVFNKRRLDLLEHVLQLLLHLLR